MQKRKQKTFPILSFPSCIFRAWDNRVQSALQTISQVMGCYKNIVFFSSFKLKSWNSHTIIAAIDHKKWSAVLYTCNALSLELEAITLRKG